MKKRLIHYIQSLLRRLLGMDQQYVIEKLKKKGLTVGENFIMQDGCIIDGSHCAHITIGNNVSLSHNVHVLAHDASTWWFLEHTKVKNTTIGNRVFIGAGSIIMPGVTIGNDVIIGAGSVVTKDVPDNSIFAGNPARFLMHTSDYIARERQLMTPENTFGEEFNITRASAEQLQQLRDAASKYGIIYLK
ncbi:hypothetical protein VF12_41225 [Nostoc linckia z15]|nr:hypothetical protein VF12_41225 [Nostoc linckia z15]